MNTLEDYISVVPDIIPIELCDEILKEFSEEKEWNKTLVGSATNPRVDDKIRTAETVGFSYPHVIDINKEVRTEIDRKMFFVAGNAIKSYCNKFSQVVFKQDTGYELLRYKEGQFYVQHTDFFKDNPRVVSCSFVLNDDYEGGEFAFFDRKLKYKLKKGSCIMFPSNFMYPHEIMPVTSGTRYSIITWFV
jgi:predicted 2-oxoglutarate/Fe(II)-dependent dioxygenase YbiX